MHIERTMIAIYVILDIKLMETLAMILERN